MSQIQDQNADHLRARFTATVLAARPESVLDFGCGGGALLRACRSAGVPAVGVEESEACQASGRKAGLDVRAPVGEGLDEFADGAFDWVTMRHVPHHLPDPQAAVRAAFRVARSGLVLAEPWFDRRFPSQATAADVDDWLKREDRRRGRVHATNHDAEGLLALVPPTVTVQAEVDHYFKPRPRPLADVLTEVERFVADGLVDHAALEEWQQLLGRLLRVGLSCNGSVTVTLRRGSARTTG